MRWEDFKDELDAIPGFKEAYEKEYPYDDVALEIAGLRGERDMTQTEFGQLVGVPQSTVARLESGQQNPSVGMLQRIAKASGMELVIEFRPKQSERPARKPRMSSTSQPSRTSRSARVAASGRAR